MIQLRVFFSNNLYLMGKGWIESKEQKELFLNACAEISSALGLEHQTERGFSAPQAFNRELFEKIYYHPMNITVTCRVENAERYITIIKQNTFFKDIRVEVLETGRTSQQLEDDVKISLMCLVIDHE